MSDRPWIPLPEPATTAWQLGAGRAALAAAILAAPVASLRVLGTDGATAQRVLWLTRMTAARDGALGAGTLLAARRGGAAVLPWLLGGAAADVVDAVVIGAALRQRRIGGAVATASVPVAAVAAVVGFVTVVRGRRSGWR